MKILPKGKQSLDGLPLLKTKKSLGHPGVQKLYITKHRILLSKPYLKFLKMRFLIFDD
jgi:hypothetical protein